MRKNRDCASVKQPRMSVVGTCARNSVIACMSTLKFVRNFWFIEKWECQNWNSFWYFSWRLQCQSNNQRHLCEEECNRMSSLKIFSNFRFIENENVWKWNSFWYFPGSVSKTTTNGESYEWDHQRKVTSAMAITRCLFLWFRRCMDEQQASWSLSYEGQMNEKHLIGKRILFTKFEHHTVLVHVKIDE